MSLQGDLHTLDLSGLFQNLEAAQKTGLLSISEGQGEARLHFRDGRLGLIAFEDRASLLDFLVAAGALARDAADDARKRRRKRTACELLVERGEIAHERLVELAMARLTDEACELLAAGWGKFEFTEGAVADGVFDPDEAALGLALPAGPLLLEAARRMDHWKLVRERIPSDSTHYALARAPRASGNPKKDELQAELLELLDGSRSVSEVVAHVPHRRFEAYELLAELEKGHAIRAVAGTDLARRIRELARRDNVRARALLAHGLEANPRNVELLATKVLLAEEAGELEDASEALRLVVHLHLEADQREEARAGLERLKALDASDPFAWERSFELALSEGRGEDAEEDARRLVELCRGPGLHRKALAVLERLVEALGESWERVRELAHARAETGDVPGAVKALEAFGEGRIAAESYPLARRAYEEILAIAPRSKRAKDRIEEIQSGELAQRRAFWRKVRRRVILGLLAAVLLPWIGYEGLARRSALAATRDVLRAGWIESGRYADAIERYRSVRASFPWATVSLYEVDRIVGELEAKLPPAPAAETR